MAARYRAGTRREKGRVLMTVFTALRGRGIAKHKISSTLHIYPKDIDAIAWCLPERRNGVLSDFDDQFL
jgi:hypothetical protein